MCAGIKPVCLIGRGFDDQEWIKAAVRISHDMGFRVVEGAQWYADPLHAEAPEWYSEATWPKPEEGPVFYISRSTSTEADVRRCCEHGISIEQEAALLGYPVCCVREHYNRTRMVDRGYF